jgi:hypothetical protein
LLADKTALAELEAPSIAEQLDDDVSDIGAEAPKKK